MQVVHRDIQLNNETLTKMFTECNHLYFYDTLPNIPIKLINSTKNLGELHFILSEFKFHDYELDISCIIRTKEQLRNVMVHEMCHLAVFYKFTEEEIKNAIKNPKEMNKLLCIEEYAHSGEWYQLASSINNLYKLNIHLR